MTQIKKTLYQERKRKEKKRMKRKMEAKSHMASKYIYSCFFLRSSRLLAQIWLIPDLGGRLITIFGKHDITNKVASPLRFCEVF